MIEFQIRTDGERLYSITNLVESKLLSEWEKMESPSGIATLFCPHTSCALTLNESCDPSAKEDLESFLKHLAPRNLGFITHTLEGEDDCPAHMKTLLLQSSISFIVENKKLVLGRWQGIYLAEFRDLSQSRTLYLQCIAK
ncbi:MAG: secondary thiamine-phosphate synthase enzyme YjbQ [Bacteriovoracaceae bacterium]